MLYLTKLDKVKFRGSGNIREPESKEKISENQACISYTYSDHIKQNKIKLMLERRVS